jgi:hypothetical protein
MSTDSAESSPPALTRTAARAIEAYGGAERWLKADRIEAVVSVTGLAWWLKMRGPVPRTKLRIDLRAPNARLDPVDRTGLVGILRGKDALLEGPSGQIVARRDEAGKYFPGGRRIFYWDSLDLAYFTGHAMWNYFTFPRQLLRPEIEWKEIADGVLEAHYPPELPTHSPVQRFHFDPKTGLLCRHDCTLEAVGPWARVTQIVDHYRERDGIPYFGLRTVYFRRRDGSRIPWPTLIVGRVFDWKLCTDP